MKNRNFRSILIFLIGLVMCSYPLISSVIERQYQKNAVSTYNNDINSTEGKDLSEVLENAKEYNSMLYQTKGGVIQGLDAGVLSEESYNSQLNISKTGMMASIEIPKINVNLPIYHGTSDDVLASGVGHLEGSSLPVGGENTRSILTGHRGLPNSKLFTRLDEIEEGDLFFIRVCDEVLAYKVNKVEVIKPEEADRLEIEPEKDLVSLVTCTPYGLNTHRLVVTGERVPYEVSEYEGIDKSMMSWRELLFASLPFIFIAIGIFVVVRNRRHRRNEENRKEE